MWNPFHLTVSDLCMSMGHQVITTGFHAGRMHRIVSKHTPTRVGNMWCTVRNIVAPFGRIQSEALKIFV